jgi:hypothetical protein
MEVSKNFLSRGDFEFRIPELIPRITQQSPITGPRKELINEKDKATLAVEDPLEAVKAIPVAVAEGNRGGRVAIMEKQNVSEGLDF